MVADDVDRVGSAARAGSGTRRASRARRPRSRTAPGLAVATIDWSSTAKSCCAAGAGGARHRVALRAVPAGHRPHLGARCGGQPVAAGAAGGGRGGACGENDAADARFGGVLDAVVVEVAVDGAGHGDARGRRRVGGVGECARRHCEPEEAGGGAASNVTEATAAAANGSVVDVVVHGGSFERGGTRRSSRRGARGRGVTVAAQRAASVRRRGWTRARRPRPPAQIFGSATALASYLRRVRVSAVRGAPPT